MTHEHDIFLKDIHNYFLILLKQMIIDIRTKRVYIIYV